MEFLKLLLMRLLDEDMAKKLKDMVMDFLKEQCKKTESPIDDHVVQIMDKFLDKMIEDML